MDSPSQGNTKVKGQRKPLARPRVTSFNAIDDGLSWAESMNDAQGDLKTAGGPFRPFLWQQLIGWCELIASRALTRRSGAARV